MRKWVHILVQRSLKAALSMEILPDFTPLLWENNEKSMDHVESKKTPPFSMKFWTSLCAHWHSYQEWPQRELMACSNFYSPSSHGLPPVRLRLTHWLTSERGVHPGGGGPSCVGRDGYVGVSGVTFSQFHERQGFTKNRRTEWKGS